MSKIKLILLIISLLLKLTKEKLETKCPTYSETTLEPKECLYKQSSERYLLHKCPINSKCILDKNNEEGLCQKTEKEYEKLAYPGGKCEKDSECLSGICENNICEGRKVGEDCIENNECNFGLSCFNGFCKIPKPKYTNCLNNFECKFPLKCFKGKCTELFSIDNGVEVDEENAFLCKSGRVYLGKCNSLKNENLLCDSDNKCVYSDINGSIFEINELCQCEYTFSEHGNVINKKCLNGDLNNENWNKLIEIMKKTLLPNNTLYCNIEEKIGSYCRETLRHNWNARIEQIYLDKYFIESKYSSILPIISKEKDLIMKTIYSFDDTPPKQKHFKCAKFSLGTIEFDNETCAYGLNPFNEYGEDIQVYINPKPCEFGYKCNFIEKKLINNWSYNTTCEYKFGKNHYQNYLKFPGESCTTDNICMRGNYNDIGECKNGYCSGHLENDICKSNSDCNLGLFCNETIEICQKLKDVGEYCTNQYECKNNLGCMNNTCFEYYSIDEGIYLQKKGSKAFKNLCKYGQVDERNGRCLGKLKYYNVDSSKIDSNGFVRCEIGELCNYTSGGDEKNIISKPCECGFNKYGYSYCPLSHDYNIKNWEKYFNIRKNYYSEGCYTLKRYDCINYDNYDEINYYKRLTEDGHKFYGAEEGVIRTLNSKNLKINFYSIFILLVILT